MFRVKIKHISSCIEYLQNGQQHSWDDLPAIKDVDGSKHWYKNGQRHRLSAPAIVQIDGYKEWWKDGRRHRLDGPAIEYLDGREVWYKDGKVHRENGPAIENKDGVKEWYVNGVRHREDGPAMESHDGQHDEWWINGFECSRKEWQTWKLGQHESNEDWMKRILE